MITILQRILSSLWAGSIWFSGLVAAPVLFNLLADNKYLAGQIAGTLFRANYYIGIVCGVILLIILLFTCHNRSLFKQLLFYVLVFMLALVAINLFGIHVALDNLRSGISMNSTNADPTFARLHAIAMGIHLSLCVLAAFLVSLNLPQKPSSSLAAR